MKILSDLGSWSLPTALELARRSAAEYLDDPRPALADLPKPDSHVMFREPGKAAFSIAFYGDELAIVTFRGTDPRRLYDLMVDGEAALRPRLFIVPDPGGAGFTETRFAIHAGFYRAFMAIGNQASRALPRTVFITGHSLGGALATVLAAELAMRGEQRTLLYTFGSPRVFNRASAEWLDKRTKGGSFRVVNDNDVVTRVPLSSWGYWHVGELCYLDRDGSLTHDPSRWELFRSRVQGRVEALCEGSLAPGLAEHHISAYVTKLQALVAKG